MVVSYPREPQVQIRPFAILTEHLFAVKDDSHDVDLTHGCVADGCVAFKKIENVLLFCTANGLPQPHASNAARLNEP